MVDTRQSDALAAETKKQREAVYAEADAENPRLVRLIKAVVVLKRTYPDIKKELAEKILVRHNLNVEQAITTISASMKKRFIEQVSQDDKEDDEDEDLQGQERKRNRHRQAAMRAVAEAHARAETKRDAGTAEGHPIILGDEASSESSPPPKHSVPVKRGKETLRDEASSDSSGPPAHSSPIKRGGAALQGIARPKLSNPSNPGAAQVPRLRAVEKKKAPDLSSPGGMVEIIVGKDNVQPYSVHESFICYYSPYFRKAFSSDQGLFVESKIRRMTIENVEPELFGFFVKWVYSQKLTDKNDKAPSVEQLVSLWILGAKFEAPSFQNAVMRGIFASRKPFCHSIVGFCDLYNNTNPGDALRRLFVNAVCRSSRHGHWKSILENHWDEIPTQMLKDIMRGRGKVAQAAVTNAELPPLLTEHYLLAE